MSEVNFRWLPEAYGGSGELAISIDGEPLADIIRRTEEPFAAQPDELAAPGQYSGMRSYGLMKSVVWQFQGRRGSHSWAGPQDKTALLACQCGEVACWPLMARITLARDVVVWGDFEQPHRKGKGRTQLWDYGDLSFVFDRQQYMESLRSADGAVREWRRTQPES